MYTVSLKESIEVAEQDVTAIDCNNYKTCGDFVTLYGTSGEPVGLLPLFNVKAILEKGKIKVGEHPETEKSDVIDIVTKLSYEAEGLDETIEKLQTIKRLMDEIGIFNMPPSPISVPCTSYGPTTLKAEQ